jgi:hypothetical protein
MIVYTLHKGGGGGDDDNNNDDDDKNNKHNNSLHSEDNLKERIWNVLYMYLPAHL